MGNTIDDQLMAYGVAQVIVVLKDGADLAATAKPTSALAAAIPVAASRNIGGGKAESAVMSVSKHFTTSEFSAESAIAANFPTSKKNRAASARWYKQAKSSTSRTPPARYFPHLGVMLGNVDLAGLKALRSDQHVREVVAPPVLSLIRPVAAKAVKAQKQVTWGIRRIQADKLHAQGLTGNSVVVGHLDTGADGKHPALKKAFHSFAEFDMLGFQVSPSPAPHDTDDHGTHTAGTIAGRTSSGRAIGIAPGAKLASAIVIEGGQVIARVLAGMDWSIGQGARILNMSLGFRGFISDFLPLTQLLRQRGVLPVFAVGNEGAGTSRSPGNYAEALSVGAMDRSDRVPDFSSSREFNRPNEPLVPDIVAPGVDVLSAMPGGGYQEMSGSSMATPHVAGLAALLMEAVPGATIEQIETAIFASCQILSGEDRARQNRGVLDAVAALTHLQTLASTSAPSDGTAAKSRKTKRKQPKAKRAKSSKKKRLAAKRP